MLNETAQARFRTWNDSVRGVGRGSLVALAFAAALCGVPIAADAGIARVVTTSPGGHVNTLVLIQNQGITVGEAGRLPRGVSVTFYVRNLTKTTKNFKFLGKVTTPIRPGHQAKLRVNLDRRGVYPYLSTLNPSRKFRGLFLVY